jgi:hypothetical protein
LIGGKNCRKAKELTDPATCQKLLSLRTKQPFNPMKKIDILNYITDFRKSPNSIKTHRQLIEYLGIQHEPTIQNMLNDLQKAKVVKQTELNGETAYQVIAK